MPKKQRMTIEEHKLAGEILSRLDQEVMTKLSVFFGNHYPTSGKLYRKLNQAYKCIREARSIAENEMFSEHPHVDDTRIYYPKGLEPDNISELVKRLVKSEG